MLFFYFSYKEIKRKSGKENIFHPLPSASNKSVMYDAAKEWFLKFIRHAEYMPNTDTKNLPSCLTKKAVYNLYKDDMQEKGVISRTTFIYRMWQKEFPWVIIPKVRVVSSVEISQYYVKALFPVSLGTIASPKSKLKQCLRQIFEG